MDQKDKLELLWKYLLLVVIAVGVAMHIWGPQFDRDYSHSTCEYSAGKVYMGGSHMGLGHGSMIKVEKLITNGDTTVVVWVGGEKIDNPEEYLKEHKAGAKFKSGHTMRWKAGHGKKGEKEIRIEIRKDSD